MTRPSWHDLNAYVDGELPPDRAAEVAAAIAGDREAAGRVAALARLKAASAEALAIDPADVPPLRPVRRRRALIPAAWRQPAGAAAVLALFLLGIAGWSALSGADAARAFLATAEARHVGWLAEEPHPVPVDERAVLLTATPGTPVRVPDLGFARLMVAHIEIDPAGSRPGLFVGYVGVNGCRLGLWIGKAAEGLRPELTEHRGQELHSFTWRVGETGYAVMARNMDAQRLAAIADHLRQLTGKTTETRVAGGAADAPCIA